MAAINEHEVHPRYRLGKRKPVPTKPRLRLANFLTGVPPEVPVAADHFNEVSDWGMYRNDEFGVCGPTALANSRKLATKYLTGEEHSPSQDAVFDLYRRSGNPNFDPNSGADDNGVILQDMLAAAVKDGLGSDKPLAFAEVDHTNIDEMMQAIAIFGFLIIGVDLRTPQQSQTDQRLWDAVSGGGEWGGHAILGGRYTNPDGTVSDRTGVITWATPVDMTDRFISSQLDEAWVVIWPEHLRDNAFLQGVNMQAFADAYKSITGRSFPGPIPRPDPVPADGPVVDPLADPAIAAHIASAAARAKITRDEWLTKHFRSYFKVGQS